jgi:hypothetical protein
MASIAEIEISEIAHSPTLRFRPTLLFSAAAGMDGRLTWRMRDNLSKAGLGSFGLAKYPLTTSRSLMAAAPLAVPAMLGFRQWLRQAAAG